MSSSACVCILCASVSLPVYLCCLYKWGLLKEKLSLEKTLFLMLKLNGSFRMNLALVYLFVLAELSKCTREGACSLTRSCFACLSTISSSPGGAWSLSHLIPVLGKATGCLFPYFSFSFLGIHSHFERFLNTDFRGSLCNTELLSVFSIIYVSWRIIIASLNR